MPHPSSDPVRLALAAMGTRFELVLPEAPATAAGRARLIALGEEALREVALVEARWSLFRRDAFLQHLVATAPHAPVRLDEDDFELLDAARRVHTLSGGAFDPCVAPEVARRGFARPGDVHAAQPATFGDVVLDEASRTVRLRRAGVALDLGGIAKGHALDRAARVLAEGGVRAALLHGGTSAVVALGAPPEHAAWRVRVGHGDGAPEVDLAGAGLAVSAHAGQRGAGGRSHIVDPRPRGTAGPGDAEHTTASAVALALAHDPAPLALADALATALLVTGDAVAAHALPHVAQALQPRDAAWRRVSGPPLFRLRGQTPSLSTTR